jgi:uncharacterized protein Usg
LSGNDSPAHALFPRAERRDARAKDQPAFGERGSLTMGHMIVKDYRLTTARIFYHLPDHPGLLQSYVWQEFDLEPDYPALRKFLDFWANALDGKVHSVEVAAAQSVRTGRVRHAGSTARGSPQTHLPPVGGV